jgi:flagellum-specific peptidoglycan hydrolase FlgJ
MKKLLLILPFFLLLSFTANKGKKSEKKEKIKIETKSKYEKDVEKYIKRFKKVAMKEHEKFGVPASITLAQGILESGSGNSVLTKLTNNHFGIKCFGQCNDRNSVQMADDSPTDRFVKYKSNWYSFRHHSKFLMMDRYKKCRDCGDDWKCWAVNLKKCGYATSKTYSQKLIKIIKKYKLYQYDKKNPQC